MSAGQLDPVVRHLRAVALRQGPEAATDADLLGRFVRRRDEAAFAALVRRHGPMVLGVCRRVLGQEQDAEDAFQATFLVLLRKAASVRPAGRVGNWLYGVAYRTALDARAAAARRRAKEAKVAPPEAPAEDVWADLRPVLDRELARLPEKYRAPLVLCDLQGKTRREAAGLLGCAEGTVASRLARGRALLAGRVGRHGLALTAGGLALALARQAAAAVPAPLLAATVHAAAGGLTPARVAALVEGVTRAMLLTKLKVATALLAALVVFGAGLGVLAQPAAEPARPAPRAAGAVPGPVEGKGPVADRDPEPIWPGWFFDKRVQKELHFTEGQIKQLAAVVNGVRGKYEPEMKAELEKHRKGDPPGPRTTRRLHELGHKMDAEQTRALAEAAPRILSARAIKRLHQINRQVRGLHRLILEPAVQKALRLDDEQVRQIEALLKEAAPAGQRALQKLVKGYQPLAVQEVAAVQQRAYAGAMRRVLAVLTPQQRRTWDDLVGEPFEFGAPQSR